MKLTHKQARDKWVKALKSGKYKQTTGQLGIENDEEQGYCCLGVACEVYDKHHVKKLYKTIDEDGDVLYDSCSSTLPDKVQHWLGLSHASGRLKESKDNEEYLTGLNDTAGYTFKAIAKVIEEGKLELTKRKKK